MQIQGSGMGWGFCKSNMFPADAWTASPQTTLWAARFIKLEKQENENALDATLN